MRIIVESGATKADWCAISDNGQVTRIQTEGMNVAVMSQDAVDSIIAKALPQLNPEGEEVKKIHFFAAGLISEESRGNVEFASDLTAAARSVCGHEKGIAAILGTGSNSCLFDGEKVVRNIRPGGFILGDEGGANNLGKAFLADHIKGLVPKDLDEAFSQAFEADYLTIVKNVYKGENPTRYLGSFAPWIVNHYDDSEYVRDLVENNFRNFFRRTILRYDAPDCPVGVVGGFGHACAPVLRKVASEFGLEISSIIATPIDGLIRYYENN